MHTDVDLQKIHRIIGLSTDMVQYEVKPLGRGATSAAWLASDRSTQVVIRIIPSGTNRPSTYQSEFTLLRILRETTDLVPEPVLNSLESRDPLPNVYEDWTVTQVIKGEAIKKNHLSNQVAQDLGGFLATMHALPVAGFGRLIEQNVHLAGQQKDQISGICARWCWAAVWPFDDSSLNQHSISMIDLQIANRLKRFKPNILSSLTQDDVVLNHTDLHGEHIFVHDRALTGVIDFGTAFIGAPSWDFAVIAYHHGWSATREVLKGYAASTDRRHLLLKQSQYLAIVISLYKLDKAIKGKAAENKLSKIRVFLTDLLDELERTQ